MILESAPFFYLPGNHDYSNPSMGKIWEERFGRSYYSFVYRDVLFVCLNSEEPQMHHIGSAQAEWLRDTLAAHQDVRWTLVFTHSPLWRSSFRGDHGWEAIEAALQGRKFTFFAGHFHSYLKETRHDSNFYVLATTGGGSSLRGPAYGEFDQVAWVTMTKDGPVIANLQLDGILPENIRTRASKQAVDTLTTSLLVPEIIWTTGDPLPERSIEILSINPLETPADVKFHITPAQGVTVEADQNLESFGNRDKKFTLQPRSTRALSATLSGLPTINPHQAKLVGSIQWETRFQSEAGKTIAIPGTSKIAVVPHLTVSNATTPINVDADASDWRTSPRYAVTDTPHLRDSNSAWTGPDDCSFSISVARDADYLYALIEVTDDQVIAVEGVAPWFQDGIEIRFDPRSSAVRRTPMNRDGSVLVVAMCPSPADQASKVFRTSEQLTGSSYECHLTTKGYIFEAKIPLTSFSTLAEADWAESGIRINVAVNDRDNDSPAQDQLWWQPDWRTEGNIPESGTCFFDD